jgi:predicted nucleic acid-binding Zn ribbon protein
MSDHSFGGSLSPGAARALVVASQEPRCEACGTLMAERKGKGACSGRCRAILSRRGREAERGKRDQEIRALLMRALQNLAETT